MTTRLLGLCCLISVLAVTRGFYFWPYYTNHYSQRSAGYFEDPCGSTLAKLRHQGVGGLPNSIHIPPPRRSSVRRRPVYAPDPPVDIPSVSAADTPLNEPDPPPPAPPPPPPTSAKRPRKPASRAKPGPAKRPAARAKPGPAKRPAARAKPSPAKRPAAKPKSAPAKRPAARPKPAPAKRPAERSKPAPATRPATRPKPAKRPVPRSAQRPVARRPPARRLPPPPLPHPPPPAPVFNPYYGAFEPLYIPPRYTPYPNPFSRPMQPWLAALLDLDVADIADVPVTTPRPTPQPRPPARIKRLAVRGAGRERYNCYCDSHWDCTGEARSRGGRYDPQCDKGYGLVCCCHLRY